MKKLLLALMFLPVVAFGQNWDYDSMTASIDEEANVTIVIETTGLSYWANPITRVTIKQRLSDSIIDSRIPFWGGYVADDLDPHGDMIDPAAIDNGDGTWTTTVSYQLYPHNITRYIGDTINLIMVAYHGPNKDTDLKSDTYYLDATRPAGYTPSAGLIINNTCGFPGVSIYLDSEYPSYFFIKWEWYDSIINDWVPWISIADDGNENFSLITVLGEDQEVLYSVANNNFSYIGARTDGQTRFTFKDVNGEISNTVVGPNILGWCGIEPDVTPPTVSNQYSGHSGLIGYYMTVDMSEACVYQSRYRVNGGTWTTWTNWSTEYLVTNSAVYSHQPQDETVDFEMNFKDQADLPCAANPITETVPSN